MTIEFKCNHKTKTYASRAERLEARKMRFEVPEDAKWERKKDMRMVDGQPELFDVEPPVYFAKVKCEECGSEKRIYTDQEVE